LQAHQCLTAANLAKHVKAKSHKLQPKREECDQTMCVLNNWIEKLDHVLLECDEYWKKEVLLRKGEISTETRDLDAAVRIVARFAVATRANDLHFKLKHDTDEDSAKLYNQLSKIATLCMKTRETYENAVFKPLFITSIDGEPHTQVAQWLRTTMQNTCGLLDIIIILSLC